MIIHETDIREISLSFMDKFYPAKDYTWVRAEKEHYRLLTYLTKNHNNITILDIGTDIGVSCLCLAQNLSNRVITYDIKHKNIDFGLPNVTAKTMDVLQEDPNIIKSANLILLDIDPHDGIQEEKFFKILESIGYDGVVICDDVNNMEYWWKTVKQRKFDLTSIGHFTGTWAVAFGNQEFEIAKAPVKRRMNLRDNTFSHHTRVGLLDVSVAGQYSNYIEWDRSCSDQSLPTFYTHECMSGRSGPKENSYGILFESQSIIGDIYRGVSGLIPDFNMVFTHSSEFLNKYPNCKWIPGGGIWVGGSFGQGSIGIKSKSKLCSFVSSDKRMCDLHNFRFDLFNSINSPKVEKLGRPWIRIHKSLDDFMFSIAVENFIDDLYFTEKILNCFATGTIPIYKGAKNISSIFNPDGIITFNTRDDLVNIINSLTPSLYESKMNAVRENYQKCLQFRCLEDFIFTNYLNGV